MHPLAKRPDLPQVYFYSFLYYLLATFIIHTINTIMVLFKLSILLCKLLQVCLIGGIITLRAQRFGEATKNL